MCIIDRFAEILPYSSMIAVSKIFARAEKQMNVYEYKAFVFALTKVKWTEKMNNIICLDKKELANYCGVHSDPDHLSVDLFEKIGDLPRDSFIKIARKDLGLYESGCFINKITMLKNQVKIKFDDEYLLLFSELKNEYITLWSDDLLRLDNSENGQRAITLYEYLRLHSDTRQTNERCLSTKELKEIWNIPKDGKGSYMLKNGHFDRSKFEQKVLEPVLEKLTKCKMINLVIQSDGKLYKKIKQGNKVLGYQLFWTVSDRPSIATAKEVKEIREAVTKNPAVLKVAKDIINGEKRKKTAGGKGSPHNFNERSYDMAQMERELLN